jgi:hypothetical protein
LFWIILGVYFGIKAKSKPSFLYFVWVPFVVGIYTFNSSRYIAPLLGFGIFIYIFRIIRLNINKFILGVLFAIFILIPIMPHLLSPQARLRFQEVSIFNDINIIKTANSRIAQDGNTIFAKITHNRRYGYARVFLTHFFDNLQPLFLFIKGDGNPKFSTQNTGQLYIVEAPLLALGIMLLFLNHRKIAYLLIYWLIVAILPAALAKETPHALRIENSLPTWQVFIAYALFYVYSIKKLAIFKKTIWITVILLYIFETSYFLHTYFVHYPKQYSGEWQYGYREALRFSDTVSSNYNQIVISDTIGRPYMYTLFYEKYDPRKFWLTKDAGFDAAGFYNVRSFGKYLFVRGSLPEHISKTLYVLNPESIPANARILKTIHLLNGKPVLIIFDIL